MNENRIGALWKPRTQSERAPTAKGKVEIGGQSVQIVVWANRWKKEGENTPDWYIEIDKPREARQDAPRETQPRQEPAKDPQQDFTDDIPF